MIRLTLEPKNSTELSVLVPEKAKLSPRSLLTPSTTNALSVLDALNLEGNLKSLLIFFFPTSLFTCIL